MNYQLKQPVGPKTKQLLEYKFLIVHKNRVVYDEDDDLIGQADWITNARNSITLNDILRLWLVRKGEIRQVPMPILIKLCKIIIDIDLCVFPDILLLYSVHRQLLYTL